MKRPFVLALYLSCAVLPFGIAAPAEASNWLNEGFGPGINGDNPNETTLSPSNVKNLRLTWQSNSPDINGVFGMVEVTGRIFVLSRDQNQISQVVALNAADGSELWTASLGSSQFTVPQTGLSAGLGRVFVPCQPSAQTRGVCAFGQNTGRLNWFTNIWDSQNQQFPPDVSRPTFAGGVVYVGTGLCPDVSGSCSYALNASSGQVLWVGEPAANGGSGGGVVAPGPAVSTPNGLVYSPCSYIFDGNFLLHFLGVCTYRTSDGSSVWNYDIAQPTSTGTSGSMGVSVVGSTTFIQQSNSDNNGNHAGLSALDAQTGAVQWTFTAPFSFHDFVQPTVAKGRVFWPDGNGRLWALSRTTGAGLWSRSAWGPACSPVGGPNGTESQPESANGVIYITTACSQSGGNFATTFALSASNGAVLWKDAEGTAANLTVFGGAPLIVDGALYTDCAQVCAYALGSNPARRPH